MLIKYSLKCSSSVNSPLLEFFRGRSDYRDQKRAFNVYRADRVELTHYFTLLSALSISIEIQLTLCIENVQATKSINSQ